MSASDAPEGSAAPGSCGDKGQPPCPMQHWMKSTMAMAFAGGDKATIAAALRTIGRKVPPGGYATWADIANEGARKADAGDTAGVKEACRQCHALYQARYRATQRADAW